MPALVLDGFVFEGFEIPEEAALGGDQSGTMTKLPGGIRVFDASGPDDDPITWRGRARGGQALARALTLDGMRRDAQTRQLAILGLSYSVVVTKFTFRPLRPWEVEYDITLEVLEDQTQGLASVSLSSLDLLVGSDIGTASSILAAANATQAAAPLAALQVAVTSAGVLQGASSSTLLPVATAAAAATTNVTAASAALDATIPADPTDAGLPDRGASALAALADALIQESGLLDAGAYLNRVSINLTASTG